MRTAIYLYQVYNELTIHEKINVRSYCDFPTLKKFLFPYHIFNIHIKKQRKHPLYK